MNSEQCELPNDLIKSELERILIKNNFQNAKITVTLASAKGDNYMGCLFLIKATLETQSASTLNLICKTEPLNAITRSQLRTGIIYQRETFVYQELFPLYQRFQEEKRVPRPDQFQNCPKCYGTGPGFLFLNDLVAEGYILYDRLKKLDFIHVSRAVEALGKYHAVGYALKQQRPAEFKRFRALQDVYYSNPVDEGLYNYFGVMFDHALEALTSVEDEDLRSKMRFLKNNLRKILPVLLDGEKAEPFAVVMHGDCWNNNIMYKYEVRIYNKN